MANLILPRKRVVQPQGVSRVNWDAIPGLLRVYNPGLSPFTYVRPSGTVSSLLNGSPTATVGDKGRTIAWDGTNDCLYESSSPISYTFRGTMFALVKPISGFNTTQQTIISAARIGNQNPIFRLATTGSASPVGRFFFQMRNVVGTFTNVSGAEVISANNVYFVIGTCFGDSQTSNLYVNGILDGTGTAPDGSATLLDRFGFGSFVRNIPELVFNGHIYLAGFASEPLDEAQAKALSANPWQIFEPQKSVVYFDVGSGGAYTLTSTNGSFVMTGQTAGLLANRTLASNAASYSLSGQIAALLAGRSITSEASSFTLAGQTAGLLADKLLTAPTGSFTLNGQSATLTYVPNSAAYVLTAADGAFLFSGQAAQLITGRLLTSNTAAFTLVGQDAALLAGRKLASSEAAFALDGATTPLLAGRLLTASEAAYSLAGQAATLIYTPVGAYILAANAATYSVSGQDALLLHNRILAGSEGSFTVTGINAGMFRGLNLSAGASAFLLSGQDITFTYVQGYTLTCATGSYTLSGQDAALIADRILTLSTAGFTLTGKDATLRTGVAVPVAIGDPDWQIVIKAFDFRTVVEGDDHRVIIH